MSLMIPELLAPAGDFERLQAAVMYGADAVYLGGKTFGMRASPQNFDFDELKKAVELCHSNARKIYLTCNVLPTNEEVGQLPDFIRFAKEIGIDAMIVADIGVLMEIKRIAPDMPVHISTQAGVVNYLTTNELYNLGASRVVLAREVSLEDIKIIREKTPPGLEIEAFVHGAMCMSFSGRCLISQYLTGRDANHGECTQPCRWKYSLVEEKRPDQYFPIFEEDNGSYILNAQDMSTIEHIDKLAKAGITSFKIEGRAKSAYYVAVITNAYRCAIDIYKENPDSFVLPEWLSEEVKKVSHRQYSTGFYFKDSPPMQYGESGGYVREWDVVAIVEGWENGRLICTERNRFYRGDKLEILEAMKKPAEIIATELFNGNGEEIDIARHPMDTVLIPFEHSVVKGTIIRKIRAKE